MIKLNCGSMAFQNVCILNFEVVFFKTTLKFFEIDLFNRIKFILVVVNYELLTRTGSKSFFIAVVKQNHNLFQWRIALGCLAIRTKKGQILNNMANVAKELHHIMIAF